MSNVSLLANGKTTTGEGLKVSFGQKELYYKTFQSTGFTSTGTGSATIAIEGSNDGVNWIVLGNVNLTLGTTVTTNSLTYNYPWGWYRANITAISGTNATVSVYMAA